MKKFPVDIMKKTGFSMIEVLVFVSILSLFFVTTAAITTSSLKQMTISQHRILASRYAEDLVEYIRGEKEENWTDFVAKTNNSGITYCFNDPIDTSTSLSAMTPSFCDSYNGITGSTTRIFKREVTLTAQNSPTTQVRVSVLVKWLEGNVEYSVPVDTVLSIWE